jgi:transcriptional regulator with XRE-family HTH domain
MKLHEALRAIRNYHDLTLADLGLQLGISISYLSELETGKSEPPLKLLVRFAEVFKLKPSDVLRLAEQLQGLSATRSQAKKLSTMLAWAKERGAGVAQQVPLKTLLPRNEHRFASNGETDVGVELDPYMAGITQRL